MAITIAAAVRADVPVRGSVPVSGWTPPRDVWRTSPGSGATAWIVIGADGRGLAAWDYQLPSGYAGVRVAPVGAGGRVGRSRELRTPVATPLTYGRDRVVALVAPAADRARRVRVAFGSTRDGFGREQTIYRLPQGALGRDVAMAGNGDGRIAVVARLFRRDRSTRIVLLERAAGRRFGPARVVVSHPFCRKPSCEGYDDGQDVSVAVGPRGDIVVAWQDGPWVMARVRRAGHGMGPTVRVGRYDRVWGGLRTAVSAQGAIWVAWFDHPVGDGRGTMSIRVATRPAGASAFGPLRELDHVEEMEFTLQQTVRLALDPAGGAFLAWHGPGAKLARLDPAGALLRTYDLGQGDVDVLETSSRPGEALAVWSNSPDYVAGTTQLFGAFATADGGLTAPERIGPYGGIRGVAAALDPVGGSATVLWTQDVPADSLTSEKHTRTITRTSKRSGPYTPR